MNCVILREPKSIAVLLNKIEESVRANSETIDLFLEPAPGTLERVKTRRHHVVCGRRGSGKTSLLRKATSDQAASGHPTAFIDLLALKDHSYSDALIAIVLNAFTQYLSFLAPIPDTGDLQAEMRGAIDELRQLRDRAGEFERSSVQSHHLESKQEKGAKAGLSGWIAQGSAGFSSNSADSLNRTVEERFIDNKQDTIIRKKPDFQLLLKRMCSAAGKNGLLILDDFYQLPLAYQPQVLDYLHGMVRDTEIWLKVGTVRNRTRLFTHDDHRGRVGINIGQDASEIDLDRLLDNYVRTTEFLTGVLQGFLLTAGVQLEQIIDIKDKKALDLLATSSGGNARDFLNLFAASLRHAETRISLKHKNGEATANKIANMDVYAAINELYDQKVSEFETEFPASQRDALSKQLDQVAAFCESRRSNCLLVADDTNPVIRQDIECLVDMKFLHYVKVRFALKGTPKRLFTAYMLDMSQCTVGRFRNQRIQLIDLDSPDLDKVISNKELIYPPSGAAAA